MNWSKEILVAKTKQTAKPKAAQQPSIVNEFRRYKRLIKKLRLLKCEQDLIWAAFLTTFKATFKIKRELVIGLQFGLKVQNIHTNYELSEFDAAKLNLKISWKNAGDEYWMQFRLRKGLFGKWNLKVTEQIYAAQPFWGLQATAGLMVLKRAFKRQMKNFAQGIKLVVTNDGKLPTQSEFLDASAEQEQDQEKPTG